MGIGKNRGGGNSPLSRGVSCGDRDKHDGVLIWG